MISGGTLIVARKEVMERYRWFDKQGMGFIVAANPRDSTKSLRENLASE